MTNYVLATVFLFIL